MRATRLAAWMAVVALGLGLGSPAHANDLQLLTNSVPPNLMILFDTSGSMADAMLAEEYFIDPDGPGPLRAPRETFQASVCGVPQAPPVAVTEGRCPGSGDPGGLDRCPDNYYYAYNAPRTLCSITFPDHDPSSQSTRYYYNYLNWLLPLLLDGDPSNDPDQPTQTKLMAAKEVIAEVVNDINPDVVDDPSDDSPTYTERVRFGLARFASSGAGGYVVTGIQSGNKASLLSTLTGLPASGGTPLSESLVDLGRYFAGEYRLGSYSRYDRTTSGSTTTSYGSVPQTPMDAECRQSFVLVMTDGEPSSDQHTSGYQSPFLSVIGNADQDANECSAPAPATCTDDPRTGRDDGLGYLESTGTDWLDDVAQYLYQADLIPDSVLEGTQNVVTYTVGFVLNHPLLSETATNGHGSYFTTNTADQLGDQIEEAVLDVISRSTSFTAATVPANRSAHGSGFFTAFFDPVPSGEMWRGHLEAYRLTLDGEVRDVNGALALDPNGDFVEPRAPYWDAAQALMDPSRTRTLYATRSGARSELLPDDASYTATTYGLADADLPSYPNYPASGVTTTDALATALTNYLHGFDVFDDDGDGDTSELRGFLLGDIFHSTPSLVGSPAAFLASEPGYGSSSTTDLPFREQFKHRTRVIYAGANDGMLHAFHAGDWSSGDDPNTSIVESGYYTLGSGEELFGYVPGMLLGSDASIGGTDPNHFSHVKEVARNKGHPKFFVDGAPVVADAWLGSPSDPNDVTKTPDEWKTVLVVGLREGGKGYLALDVTDPSAAPSAYPNLLWEFTHPQLGESWSEPIVTRVRRRAASGIGDHCGADDGDGDCREEWVAIFGAGYEDSGNPNALGYVSSPGGFSTTLAQSLTPTRTGMVDVTSSAGFPASGSFSVRIGSEVVLCSGKGSNTITIAARGQAGTGAVAHGSGSAVVELGSDASRGRGFFMVELDSGAVLAQVLYDPTATDGREDLDFAFPSRPAVLDLDFDGFADVVYLGDLGGQLWKWDISAVGEDTDGLGLIDNWSAGIFFAAPPEAMTVGGSHYKSIFFPSAASYHDGKLLLSFGTGERQDLFYPGSASDDENNRFYVVEDSAPTGASAFPGALGEADLSDIGGADADTVFNDKGFYFGLDDGEKIVTDLTVFAGFVIAATYVPDPPDLDVCSRGGSSRLYVFSVTSGLGFYFDAGVVSGNAARFVTIGGGVPSDPRLSLSPSGADLFVQTSEGEITRVDPPDPGDLQRTVYWRTRF